MLLFIGRVARAAGVSVHTIRYYERRGLLRPPQRTQSGYRVYEQAVVDQLRFIQRAHALGFSLAEVKEILRLKYAAQSPCACVRRRLRQRLAEIEQEMKRLRTVRAEVRACLDSSRHLRPLPHAASAICPIIESHRLQTRMKGGEKESEDG